MGVLFYPQPPQGVAYAGAVDVFAAYRQELSERDLAPTSRGRYLQVLGAFEAALEGQGPSPASAQAFVAHLREKGYQPRSIALYYTVLKSFLAFLGISWKLRLRKVKEPAPHWDEGDIESLIAQAERGLSGRRPPSGGAVHTWSLPCIMLACAGGRRVRSGWGTWTSGARPSGSWARGARRGGPHGASVS